MKGAEPSHAPHAPRRVPTMAFKFAFAVLLAALAFAATYASSPEAFSDYDVRNVLALGAAFNIVASLGVLFALRRKNAANAALSLVVLASAVTAYVVHTDLWLAGSRTILVLLCAMSFAGLFVAFRVIDETRWGGAALSAAAFLALWEIAGPNLGVRSPAPGDVSNIRHVSFQRTPNLYFVSFDALAPRALLRKYLGVETTGFHELFDAEMRRFPNFFANAVGTTHSFNTTLALEAEVYASQRAALKKKGRNPNPFLFAGHNPSPLFDLLHRNGYETTSMYIDSYLGRSKGPHVDRYIRLSKNTVCNKMDPGLRKVAFWGYCRFGGPEYRLEWIVEELEKVTAREGPQFAIAYLDRPKHTLGSFRYGNPEDVAWYRKTYVKRSDRAARHLERLIRHLEENDPDAILLVFGDHGPWLTRGMKFRDGPTFVLQDRFGVLGGVWPPDACAAELDETSAKGWMTILGAVHAILRCLSGGEGALVEPRGGPFPSWASVPPGTRYEEFLYE